MNMTLSALRAGTPYYVSLAIVVAVSLSGRMLQDSIKQVEAAKLAGNSTSMLVCHVPVNQ